MGDQFLALAEEDEFIDGGDDHRHFGLVVDDPSVVERLPTTGLDFRDPWGNRIQIVAYEEIQFTQALADR